MVAGTGLEKNEYVEVVVVVAVYEESEDVEVG